MQHDSPPPLSQLQQDELKIMLGTLYYLKQRAEKTDLPAINDCISGCVADIEHSLVAGFGPKSVEAVADSSLLQLMNFTGLLSKSTTQDIELFLDNIDSKLCQ